MFTLKNIFFLILVHDSSPQSTPTVLISVCLKHLVIFLNPPSPIFQVNPTTNIHVFCNLLVGVKNSVILRQRILTVRTSAKQGLCFDNAQLPVILKLAISVLLSRWQLNAICSGHIT